MILHTECAQKTSAVFILDLSIVSERISGWQVKLNNRQIKILFLLQKSCDLAQIQTSNLLDWLDKYKICHSSVYILCTGKPELNTVASIKTPEIGLWCHVKRFLYYSPKISSPQKHINKTLNGICYLFFTPVKLKIMTDKITSRSHISAIKV